MPETGLLKVGDDMGVFIREDDALVYARALKLLDLPESLSNLSKLLDSCVVIKNGY